MERPEPDIRTGDPFGFGLSLQKAAPWLGVTAAIAVTTAMDANGLSVFSALPLFPLAGLFWLLQRFTRKEIGLAWGRGRHYRLALLYPVVVPGAAALAAWFAGAVDVSGTDWRKAGLNMALIGVTTVIMSILTEEGFFRGWLWAALHRAGNGETVILVLSSIAFSLWHVSAVSLDTGFDLPFRQIPVFLVNATLLGLVWGLLRKVSGSVVVAGVSHGLWNGLVYTLFGFGDTSGALGIRTAGIFGPEVGYLGIALNLLFTGWLWRRLRKP